MNSLVKYCISEHLGASREDVTGIIYGGFSVFFPQGRMINSTATANLWAHGLHIKRQDRWQSEELQLSFQYRARFRETDIGRCWRSLGFIAICVFLCFPNRSRLLWHQTFSCCDSHGETCLDDLAGKLFLFDICKTFPKMGNMNLLLTFVGNFPKPVNPGNNLTHIWHNPLNVYQIYTQFYRKPHSFNTYS